MFTAVSNESEVGKNDERSWTLLLL